MRDLRGSRGFSLLELLVVMAVGLIVMAIAVPSLTTSYRSYRIGSALRDTSNIISRTRFEAIRNSRFTPTVYAVDRNNNQEFGIDANNNGALDPGEPFVIIPSGITLLQPANAAGFFASTFSMGPGYLPQNLGIPDNFAILFSQRGNTSPCPPGVITCPGMGVLSGGNRIAIGVLFIQDTAGNWGAITVTPIGAVQTWRASAGQMIWHRQ